MTARIEIEDKQVDETFLELVLEDLWDIVKAVRKRRGPRQQVYTLTFGATVVSVTVKRERP